MTWPGTMMESANQNSFSFVKSTPERATISSRFWTSVPKTAQGLTVADEAEIPSSYSGQYPANNDAGSLGW